MDTRPLDQIQDRLARFRPRRIPGASRMRQAAVAAVFRDGPSGVELLFIRRAEHPRDPWSGHMAFPGGRVDPVDSGPYDAALRETQEEIALDLRSNAVLASPLSHVVAGNIRRAQPLIIHPFVFTLHRQPNPFVLDASEIQETVWIPWSYLADPSNRTTFQRPIAGLPMTFGCYRWEDRVIWGLTYRMLTELMEEVGRL